MNKLFKHLRQVTRVAAGRVNAGRGLTVFPDDVFLVSYGRSGSTWARFLIANLLRTNHEVTFLNIESQIPDIYMFPDRVLRRMPRPRILKSHEPFDHRYKKVIYIVRDPRDLAISLYHYDLKRGGLSDGYPMDEFVRLFVEGSEKVISWGPWGEHVISWVSTRGGREGFLLIRYEDLIENPERELAKISVFLQVDGNQQKLARAVELSSITRMKKLEKAQSRQWAETKKTRQDKTFVRKGVIGEWQSALSKESICAIEDSFGPIMRSLGYDLTRTPQSPAEACVRH